MKYETTVTALDISLKVKRTQLRNMRSTILEKRRERDRAQAEIDRLERDRAAVMAEVGDLEAARTALAKIAGSGLQSHGTLPLEGPANDSYKLLGAAHVRSQSSRTKFYRVEVRLYGQRVVLTCDCARFTFTRGEYASGKKQHCKHIEQFKTNDPEWRTFAFEAARAQGVVGRIVYSEGVYDYECIVAGTRNAYHRRVAIS